MNKSHVVSPSMRLFNAFSTGDAHARTVVDNDQVVGMLLMRDVIALAASDQGLQELTVAEAMHDNPVCISETPNKLAMARKFAQHHIKSLVVTDEEGHYLGDLDPPDAINSLPSGLMGFFQPASRCMIRDPYGIAADGTMQEALLQLAKHHVSCLLVHDATGEAVGMVSESDVMHWLLNGKLAQNVSDHMSSPISSMSDRSSLMQVWDEMNTIKVLRMVMLGDDGRVSGLVTTTDVLIALCQSMLDTFTRYRCPEGTDMMLEWHKGGMIMAVSDALLQKVGCEHDDIVGLDWAQGLEELTHTGLLGLNSKSEMMFDWLYHGEKCSSNTLHFSGRRDAEQPVMWWSLT